MALALVLISIASNRSDAFAVRTSSDRTIAIQRARAAVEQERYADAIAEYRRAVGAFSVRRPQASDIQLMQEAAECIFISGDVNILNQFRSRVRSNRKSSMPDSTRADIAILDGLDAFFREAYEEADTLFQNARMWNMMLRRDRAAIHALWYKGTTARHATNYAASISCFSLAAEIARVVGSERLENRMRGCLADAYLAFGNCAKAEEELSIALANTNREQWQLQRIEQALILGEILFLSQDYHSAKRIFHSLTGEKSRRISTAVSSRACYGYARCLFATHGRDSGVVYLRRAIDRASTTGSINYMRMMYREFVHASRREGDGSAALAVCHEAQTACAARRAWNEVLHFTHLEARLHLLRHNIGSALQCIRRSERLLRNQDDEFAMAEHLTLLSEVAFMQQELRGAIRYATEAISRLETIQQHARSRVPIDEHLGLRQRAFCALAAGWIGTGKLDSAFFALEQMKMKSTFDQFSSIYLTDPLEAAAAHRIMPDASELDAFEPDDARSGSVVTRSEFVPSERQTSTPRNENSRTTKTRLSGNPRFAKLSAASARDVRSHLIDANTALIEYGVGATRTSVIVVTNDTIIGVVLPFGAFEIESQIARFTRSRESIVQLTTEPVFSVDIAESLYRTLLLPLESILSTKRRWIVLPDDRLWILPFEQLVTDTRNCRNRFDIERARFLVEDYSISYGISASHLMMDRRKRSANCNGILIFATPGSVELARLQPSAFFDSVGKVRINHSMRQQLPKLRHAYIETQKITSIFSDRVVDYYVYFDATEKRFVQEAPRYQVLHLATHQLIDPVNPLYSRLILSKVDDSEENNGLLELRELASLRLNAELAVLSSCQSGSGKLLPVNGIISLARGFYLAGVPSIIMTLWDVEDRETAELMTLFYQHLHDGKSRTDALAQAKRDMISRGKRNPYYWAGVVLHGTPDRIVFEESQVKYMRSVVLLVGAFSTVLLALSIHVYRGNRRRILRWRALLR